MTTKGNVTIMKTVMGAALVCAVFMGCNKDLTEENGGILLRNENNGVVSQAIAPDVWVEEGRLALRDLDVRDSMVNVLAGMTDKDREMMERARGFVLRALLRPFRQRDVGEGEPPRGGGVGRRVARDVERGWDVRRGLSFRGTRGIRVPREPGRRGGGQREH